MHALIRSLPGCLLALAVAGVPGARAQPAGPAMSGTGVAGIATMAAATQLQLTMTAEPPPAPDAVLARTDRPRLPHALPLPVGASAVARADSAPDPRAETRVPAATSTGADTATALPGTFTLFRNSSLGNTIKSNTSGATGEPAIAQAGNIVFATGNWWAGISSDGGQTFSYIDPSTQFPSVWGGFCCDQVVIYEPGRDLFIWSMQYISSGAVGAGQNAFRISVARPADALRGSWYTWTFNSAVNTEWDFPDLCAGNNYAYLSTNRGGYNTGSVNQSWVFRFPLNELSTGSAFSYNFLDLNGNGQTNLSLRCARGSRDTVYFGSHNSTSQIRVFNWPENSASYSWNDVNLSTAWTDVTRICPTPDGRDWCGFGGGRMLAGWVSRGLIGFLWDAAQGGSFPQPYVEGARVAETTRAYVDRPVMYSGTTAFQYPAAATNARGDVGVVVHASSALTPPHIIVAIDDDVSRAAGFGPPAWEVLTARIGSQGPNTNRWGDYFSVQPYQPSGLGWVASGTTMQGCGAAGCKETRYVVFGRERDTRAITLVPPCSLDVDGNGTVDPLTDGLLILRSMFGLTGTQVTNAVIGAGATRNSWALLRPYLNGNCGGAFAP